MNNNFAPIVLFTYNRPKHTKRTLEALALNNEAKDSILYIFCDGAKENATQEVLDKINDVRKISKQENRFKEVIVKIQDKNKGLANSIIDGVTEIVNRHGKVIVLEDDILVSNGFLNYMNQALDMYENEKQVFHINAYNNYSRFQPFLQETYFLTFMSCWGWATWKDRWQQLDNNYQLHLNKLLSNPNELKKFTYNHSINFHKQLEQNISGKIKTWAILWFSTIFFKKGLCLTPKYSFVNNIGFDGTGENCSKSNRDNVYFVPKNKITLKRIGINESFIGSKHLEFFYRYGSKKHPLKVIYSEIIRKVRSYKKSIEFKYLNLDKQINKKWFGSEYGGFFIYTKPLNKKSVVYSFGIGEDISFDLEIVNNYSSEIFAYDPTPKSSKWISQQNLPINFKFYNFGIDVQTGIRNFSLPKNEEHVYGSAVLKAEHLSDKNIIEVQMKSISDIMKINNHKIIDVLKMDIEGSEYEVLEDILNKNLKINQILVEFHDRFFEEKHKSRSIIRKLRKKGYLLFGISNTKEELSFIHKNLLSD